MGDATHPVYVNSSGVATRIDKVAAAASADTATSATKATQDGNGANIANTYAKKTELPTVNNATLTIQKNGATVDTFTANASANKTINITVPTTTSGLTNDSGFITADDLPKDYTLPVATTSALGGVKSGGNITVSSTGAVTVNSATKATQDASGNVITTTYATKSELTNGLSGKQATLSGAQLNAVNSGITSTKVSTYDGYNAKITAAQTAAESAQSAATAAQNAANAKVATAQGSAAANKAVITNSSGNITTGTIASGMIANDAVTSAKIATGAVDATALASGAVTSAKIADGTIVNADIASNAAIAASKISGLATVATSGSYDDLTDKPTIPAAITVDSALSSTSTNPVQNKVVNAALAGKLSTTGTAAKATADAKGNNIANTYATKAQLTALDSTSSGTGAVVTNVSQTGGKVSVTKGNVKIPVGSANATTYATIWVQ